MLSEMSSRERVMTALEHRATDRIPFVPGVLSTDVRRRLSECLGYSNAAELESNLQFLSDIRRVNPLYIGPGDRHCILSPGKSIDIWGVERTSVSYGLGSYEEITRYPLADVTDIADLDRFSWPEAAWFDAVNFRDQCQTIGSNRRYAIRLGNGNIFESSWYMRGLEQMLVDLLIDPELAWEIMRRVTDYFIAFFRRMLSAADGMVDIVFTADDIGQQQGLLMSLDLWEGLIKPHHVRLNRVLHEFGVKIMYHTDGAVMDAVPGLIDMGIDILEALQFDARGMNSQILKDFYGGQLCFHGGVSVQKTLPFGTPEDVTQEVVDRISVLGRNGGYILAPSHVIQAGTPAENIMAFWTAARPDFLELIAGQRNTLTSYDKNYTHA